MGLGAVAVVRGVAALKGSTAVAKGVAALKGSTAAVAVTKSRLRGRTRRAQSWRVPRADPRLVPENAGPCEPLHEGNDGMQGDTTREGRGLDHGDPVT